MDLGALLTGIWYRMKILHFITIICQSIIFTAMILIIIIRSDTIIFSIFHCEEPAEVG